MPTTGLPSPRRPPLPGHPVLGSALVLTLASGCGQLVSADAALSGSAAPLALASPAEMAEAETLLHYAMDGLLALHTDELDWGGGEARHVDYDAFLNGPEARVALAQSLELMSAVALPQLVGHSERQAFAYNLYNGWMLAAAVDALQRDAGWAGVSSNDFEIFDRPMVHLDQAAADGGMVISLNQLEHGILRGDPAVLGATPDPVRARDWHDSLWAADAPDPRLHVALNCASRSCPDLPAGAWQGTSLDQDLDDATARFLAHPGKGAGPSGVSALFEWYAEDFAPAGGTAGFIETHREGGTVDVELGTTLPYDWELNRR